MWLILSEPHDTTGAWLAEGMRERTVQPVIHLTSREIGPDAQSERGMARDGSWFRLQTASGQVVDSRVLRGVINRTRALPSGLAQRMNLPDYEQVVANFSAPLLRWLRDVACPVLNRPTGQGLSGDFRIDGEWNALADSAGFLSAPGPEGLSIFRQAQRTAPLAEMTNVARVVVVGERVVPLDGSARVVPPALAAKCLKLANAANASLLGIDAVRLFPRDWRFFAADQFADLCAGGSTLLDAMAAYLDAPPPPIAPAKPVASEEKRPSARGGFRNLLHLW